MANDEKKQLLLLLLLAIPFLFWGIGSVDLLDPDQGMWGAIAREMAEGGDWITPHFNGVRFLEKPPLYYWLTALTILIVGPSEWAVRLWCVLPALGTALLTWRIGRQLYGAQAGLFSGMIFVSSLGVFHHARVPATDCLLVFSISLTLYGFIESTLKRAGGKSAYLLCYVGAALSALSKGLIGLVLCLLIFGTYLWLTVGTIHLRQFNFKRGLALFGVLTVPWYIAVAWRNPGFLWFYFVDNHFLRFLGRRAFIEDDISSGSLAFLLLIFVWVFPWSFFLPATIRKGFPQQPFKQPQETRLRLLVGLWALIVIGFFTLSRSKLEHYMLPALPSLSLMIGAGWADVAVSPNESNKALAWCLGSAALGLLLFAVGLLLFADRLSAQALFSGLAKLNVFYRILREQGAPFPFDSVAPFVRLLKQLGLALSIGLPLSFILFYFRLPKASFGTLLALAGVIGLLDFKFDVVIEPYQSSRAVAKELLSRLEPGDIIVHEGSLEYSAGLPFYAGRRIYVLNGKKGVLDFGSSFTEAKHLFLDEGKFIRLWEDRRRVFLVTRSGVQGSVLEDLPKENLFFIRRYGMRWLYSNSPVFGGQK